MTENSTWTVLLISLDSLKDSLSEHFGEDKSTTLRARARSIHSPSVDFYYLVRRIDELKTLLNSRTELSLQKHYQVLAIYSERIDAWVRDDCSYLLGSNYSNNVILSLVLLLDDIRLFVQDNTSPIAPEVDLQKLNKLRLEIQSLEKNKKEQEQKLGDIKESLQLIIDAKDTALKLPETLESLQNAEKTVSEIQQTTETSKYTIEKVEKFASDTELFLVSKREEIASLVTRAEEALRASTGAGLAQAFSNNATKLKESSHCWCSALVGALFLAVVIGYCRMSAIFDLIKNPNIDTALVWANILMSFALIAAPTWFAWIAAKRIAHLFRLIEDYEFKAAVSMSYEGYSREAAKYDDSDLAERILESALTRFDEPPLRFVEPKDDGHPLLEMLERLFSAKWRLPSSDTKSDPKNEAPKSNPDQS